MSEYVQLEFQSINAEQSDILLAKLSIAGFEGFEEEENTLKAFIICENYKEEVINEIAQHLKIGYQKTIIGETNWNQLWESNFEPVVVGDFVAIRAHFHEPVEGVKHEIVITPKMSFGTGHHATTFMMIRQMQEMNFTNKTVFDFGTGTGILAILAEKMGAARIVAIDNDDWSIENTSENLQRNNCEKVELKKADNAVAPEKFNIILANINKNVIMDNFSILVEQLAPESVLLLSGLLTEDQTEIVEEAGKFSLNMVKKTEDSNWISLRFNHE